MCDGGHGGRSLAGPQRVKGWDMIGRRSRALRVAAAASIVLGSGIAAVTMATPASAAGFADGGFEGLGGGHGTGSHFGAWTVTVDDVQVVGSPSPWLAHGGSNSIDLDGVGGSRGTICQTFDTDPGASYDVDFFLSRNGVTPTVPGSDDVTMRVTYPGGSDAFEHNDPAWTPADPRWEAHQVGFTATAASSQLCFASIASTHAGFGPVLDDISVTQVASAQAFVCDPSRVFLAQGSTSQLKELVAGSGSSTFTNIGTATALYNGIAYNDADDFIYGSRSNGHIVRVDANGIVADLGNATPAVPAVNAGAIDAATGTYFLTSSGDNVLYKVNLSDLTSTSVPMSQVGGAADVTFIDGFLWGEDANGAIVRIDPASGAVTRYAGIVPASVAAGAAWTYANGNLGLSDNGSGDIYQVHIANGATTTPTITVVSVSSGPPTTGNNDGTSCEGPPADLGLTKTASPEILVPGGPISWTITVTNHGPGISSGHVVKDTIPAGVTGLATSSPGCSLAGHELTCVGGVLPVDGSTAYTVTGTAPTSGGSLANDASVTGNEDDPNPGNNGASATSFAVQGLCEARSLGLPLGINLAYANPAETPCAAENKTVLDANVAIGPVLLPLLQAGVKVQVATGFTTKSATSAHGESNVASVTISVPALGLTIKAMALHSEASASVGATCGSAALSSLSRLATLQINGLTIPVTTAPITIPLVVGSLSINQLQSTGSSITRRVLNLDLPGNLLDVVVGESKAGIACQPA